MSEAERAQDLARRNVHSHSTSQPPLEVTAHHEAGNLSAMLHCGIEIRSATVEPTETAWGHVTPATEKAPIAMQLFYLYCGESAEAKHTGDHLTVALRQSQVDGDQQIIDSLAALIEKRHGSVARIEALAAAQKAAFEFTEANSEVINALASLLIDKGTITGDQAVAVFKAYSNHDS